MFSYTYSFSKTFVIVSILLWLLIPSSITITEAYPFHKCTNETTYTPNSTFQANLNLLLSSLSSNATTINGYYNSTAGLDAPDVAYGHFLCRGDIAGTSGCQDCVALAVKEIVQQQYCPSQKKAFIWYNECMLRYANQSFFSTMEDSPAMFLWNENNMTEQDRFKKLLGVTMDDIATQASNDQSGNVTRYATKEPDFTAFQKLYSLAQCTPDLSVSECDRCLRVAISHIPSCCDGKQGWWFLLPSCNIRFEVTPFYSSIATSPPPTPIILSPPAPTPLKSPPPKGKIQTTSLLDQGTISN